MLKKSTHLCYWPFIWHGLGKTGMRVFWLASFFFFLFSNNGLVIYHCTSFFFSFSFFLFVGSRRETYLGKELLNIWKISGLSSKESHYTVVSLGLAGDRQLLCRLREKVSCVKAHPLGLILQFICLLVDIL